MKARVGSYLSILSIRPDTEQAGTVCKRGKDDFRVNLGDGAWGKLVQMEA